MTSNNAQTAREFIRAWEGHAGARRAIVNAAQSQAVCAGLSRFDTDRNEHLRAAAVLNHAAQRLAA